MSETFRQTPQQEDQRLALFSDLNARLFAWFHDVTDAYTWFGCEQIFMKFLSNRFLMHFNKSFHGVEVQKPQQEFLSQVRDALHDFASARRESRDRCVNLDKAKNRTTSDELIVTLPFDTERHQVHSTGESDQTPSATMAIKYDIISGCWELLVE